MTAALLVEWTLRSSSLIAAAAVVLWTLRITMPTLRLAVWTVTLVGSIVMPMLTTALPAVYVPSITIRATAPQPTSTSQPAGAATADVATRRALSSLNEASTPHGDRVLVAGDSDWRFWAMAGYLVGAAFFCIRVFEQAVEEQLGLKLREAKRQVPVFVIDHIEERPTEN